MVVRCSTRLLVLYIFFFFFQAEDGIRDLTVTGVQTCALPISSGAARGAPRCGGSGSSLGTALPPWGCAARCRRAPGTPRAWGVSDREPSRRRAFPAHRAPRASGAANESVIPDRCLWTESS